MRQRLWWRRVYVIPTPGGLKNSVAVADATGHLLSRVLDHAGSKMAVVAMGNPYVVADFPGIQTYYLYVFECDGFGVSAAKALFGEIPIRGHLPVSIPNVAQRGAGIERQARVAGGEFPDAKIPAKLPVARCLLALAGLFAMRRLQHQCKEEARTERSKTSTSNTGRRDSRQHGCNARDTGCHLSRGRRSKKGGTAIATRRT